MSRQERKQERSADQSVDHRADVGNDPEELMTTRELMDFLNLSRTKIWNLVTKGDLPAFKVGGDYRYRRSEILAWLEKYRVR